MYIPQCNARCTGLEISFTSTGTEAGLFQTYWNVDDYPYPGFRGFAGENAVPYDSQVSDVTEQAITITRAKYESLANNDGDTERLMDIYILVEVLGDQANVDNATLSILAQPVSEEALEFDVEEAQQDLKPNIPLTYAINMDWESTVGLKTAPELYWGMVMDQSDAKNSCKVDKNSIRAYARYGAYPTEGAFLLHSDDVNPKTGAFEITVPHDKFQVGWWYVRVYSHCEKGHAVEISVKMKNLAERADECDSVFQVFSFVLGAGVGIFSGLIALAVYSQATKKRSAQIPFQMLSNEDFDAFHSVNGEQPI